MTTTSSTTSTTVSTGTVATTGSTTYVVGAASGIDTSALVDAAYADKLAPADTLDAKISDNETKIGSYQTLQSLAQALEDSLDALRASYGYGVEDTSVYSQKSAYMATSDGTDTDNLVSVSVDGSAEQGTYSLTVEQLAKAEKVTSAEQTSKTTALGYTGSFSLGLDGGTSASIDVTSDMSLQDIADAINNTTSDSGVAASVIKTSDSGYTLVLTGTATGENITYSSDSGDDVLQSLGVTDSSGSFLNVTQAAQQAIINLDGLTITGSDNTFDDVIDGVSISLVGAAPDTTITMEVDYDYTDTKTDIQSFIDAYNNLRDFFITNSTVASDGTVSSDAVLFSDTIMKSLSSSVSSMLTSMFSTTSGISTLSEIGITLDSDNKLEVSDETALNNALLNNYDSIQQMFQTSVTTDNDNIQLIRNSSTSSSMSFTMDVTTDSDGNVTGVSVDGDTSAFTFDGTRIIGAAGTQYAGLTFAYVGGVDASINVDLSQGLADRLSNLMAQYDDTSTGTIQTQIDTLTNQDDDMTTRSDRIKELADDYRTKLIEKYSEMESNISAANLLLKQVEAILGNNSSSNG